MNFQKTSCSLYSLIFFTFFYVLVLTSLGFMVDITITKWHLPVSVFLSIVSSFALFGRKDIKTSLISLSIFFFLCFASYFISINYYDFSFDGMTYHQDAIVIFSKGWNPLRGSSDSIHYLWIDHYQKGVELIQSVIYKFTGHIESGKSYNFMLITGTFLIMLDTVKIYLKSSLNSVLFSIISVCCPIVLVQTFTYYTDFIYYLLFLSLICNVILLFLYNSRNFYLLFIAISVLLCNIKFSTIPTFAIICFFTCIYVFWKKKTKLIKPLFISFFGVFVFCIITNYNPFITNLTAGKHLFHPLMGAEKVDIMKHNTPPYILGKNRFEKFYYSIFSEADNKWMDSHKPEYKSKIPFFIKSEELEVLKDVDTRMGGFGVFFSAILILSIIILISVPLKYVLDREKHLKDQIGTFLIFYFLTAVLLVSIIINPEIWWARYIPQLWLIPIISLLVIWKIQFRYFRILKYFLFFTILFNVIIHGTQVIAFELRASKSIRNLLKEMKEEGNSYQIEQTFFQNIHLRLKENNIPYTLGKIEGDFFYMPETFNNIKLKEISNIEKLDSVSLKEISLNFGSTLYDFLNVHFNNTIVISAKDESSQGLSAQEIKNIKQKFGLNLDKIKYRGAYVAIIDQGKIVLEQTKDDNIIEIKKNPSLKNLGISKIVSAGYNHGNTSSIRINKSELSLNKRGFNIVLIQEGQIYLLNIDSFQSSKVDSIVYKPNFKE